MLAHYRLDSLRRLIRMVEWDRGDVVVEDVRFDDAVEQASTDEAELAVDRGCGTTCEVPGLALVMWEGRISMLKEGDCNCNTLSADDCNSDQD